MKTSTPSSVPALSDEAFERFVRLVRRQLGVPTASTLLLYTDGLIERRADGRSIDAGTERLVGCLRDLAGLPLEALLDALVEQLGDGRDDDIAVLAVRGRSLA